MAKRVFLGLSRGNNPSKNGCRVLKKKRKENEQKKNRLLKDKILYLKAKFSYSHFSEFLRIKLVNKIQPSK